MNALSDTAWLAYPMGPRTRRFLGLKEESYVGKFTTEIDDEKKQSFQKKFEESLENCREFDAEDLLALMEELIQMNLPFCAVLLSKHFRETELSRSPRYFICLGAAAMMLGDWAPAESFFKEALELAPEEVSLFVNLSELLYQQERDGEAIEFARKGILLEPNNRRLWDVFASAWAQLEGRELASQRITELGLEARSWLGRTMGKCIVDAEDALLRAQALEECYDEGMTDLELCVDLSGAWGVTQQYAKIPVLLYRLEKLTDQQIPWQIFAHAAQAQLALQKVEAFQEIMDKAITRTQLPEEARVTLMALRDEVLSELKPASEQN